MLGLGLGTVAPYILYGLSFVVAFLSIFYRVETGILFLTSLFPIYSLVVKVLKSDLPLANNINDMVIIAMLFGWFLRKKVNDSEQLKSSPLILPISILVCYTFVSLIIGTANFGEIFSEINVSRLQHWKNYMTLPLLYIIAYSNLKERKWKYALFILLFITFVVADFRFQQSFKWVKHTHYTHKIRLDNMLGTLGPNELAGFHAIYTLFLVGLFIIDKHICRRIAYGLLITGGIYALIYSFSRGAYVGILVGILFIAMTSYRKLLIPFIIFMVFWESLVPIAVVERVKDTFVEEGTREDVVKIGDTELATAGRTEVWDEALGFFYGDPITGKGYNTFQLMTGIDTHNVYLKFLAEQGIIGLFIYLWLYWLAFKSGWRLYHQADEQLLKAFGFGFTCAVVGSIVVNFFGDRWTYLQIGGIYWVIWALVDQENRRLEIQKKTSSASDKGKEAEVFV